jgi:hypothetical protein
MLAHAQTHVTEAKLSTLFYTRTRYCPHSYTQTRYCPHPPAEARLSNLKLASVEDMA